MSAPTSPRPEAPYCRVATFRTKQQAGRAYQRIQDLLFAATGTDLSAYRFYSGPTWYVAIVGLPPSSELDQHLRTVLARGTITTLSEDVLTALLQRRAEATQAGPWIERHYRLDR